MPQVSLANDQEEEIYRLLNGLRQGDWVTVTHFQPVKSLNRQPLGEYTLSSGPVKKVNDVEQLLVLENMSVPFGNIHAITAERVEGADTP